MRHDVVHVAARQALRAVVEAAKNLPHVDFLDCDAQRTLSFFVLHDVCASSASTIGAASSASERAARVTSCTPQTRTTSAGRGSTSRAQGRSYGLWRCADSDRQHMSFLPVAPRAVLVGLHAWLELEPAPHEPA